MPIYQIAEETEGGYHPYGAAAALWRCKDPEIIISGPSETGKTLASLHKLDALAWKYPGMQGAIVRKTYNSIIGTVLNTYTRRVLGEDSPVKPFGGSLPLWFDYPTGSRIYIAGMDKSSRVLSAERDVIYINQGEELQVEEYEYLTTRATGRAGNMPYAQVILDCNPGPPKHWILQRRDDHKCTFLESRHEDNPTLFDPATGQITDRGRRSMAVLDKLTGVRYFRLRKGLWVSAEGVVYEFDPAVHMRDQFPIPDSWPRYISIDFGFANPFVAGWWALDEDRRAYLYREIYFTNRLVEDHAKLIKKLSAGEFIRAVICDHDAEDRATFERHAGMRTLPAYKAISPGIQAVQSRLQVQEDGRPRLYLLRDTLVEADPHLLEHKQPICTRDEMDMYVWPQGQDGKPQKEVPVDAYNHGADMTRYLVAHIDNLKEQEENRMPMPSTPIRAAKRPDAPSHGATQGPKRKKNRPIGLSGKIPKS